MKIGEIKARIEERMNDSKRDKIRATYALEILNDYESLYQRDDSYNKDFTGKTITITAYCETKEQSRLLDEYITRTNKKLKRVIQKV